MISLSEKITYNLKESDFKMNLAYLRVSDISQNLDRQINTLKRFDIEERFIFIEKASGKNFDRPQYQALKNVIRKGDLLYLDSLDRLGRNYDQIIKEWKEITREIEADIVCLDNTSLFDSRKFKELGDLGKLLEDQFLSLLAYIAEDERKKLLRRQREGIAAAQAKGKHLGRPRINLDALSKEQMRTLNQYYHDWKAKKITGVEFAKRLDLKKNTFYKIIKEHEKIKKAN